MKNFNDLRESIGLPTQVSARSIPKPNADCLDSAVNIRKYARAKLVLEEPNVNSVLRSMDALDLLNPYNIDSYYNMAREVVSALNHYVVENEGTDEEYNLDHIPNMSLFECDEALSEFAEEFLIEFTADRFGSTMPRDKDQMMKLPPKQSSGWGQKLAAKLGVQAISWQDLVFLYFLNRSVSSNSGEKSGHRIPRNVPQEVHESLMVALNEKAPPGMEGWIKSRKKAFKAEYGDNWEEVLYSTAWKMYRKQNKVNENSTAELDLGDDWDTEIPYSEMKSRLESAGWDENGGIALWSHPDHKFWLDGNTGIIFAFDIRPVAGPFSDVSDESFLEAFYNMDDLMQWIDSGEGDKAAEKMINMGIKANWRGYVKESAEERAAPKLTAKVKKDVNQRLKEIDDLIKNWKEKKHFYGEVKPAIFHARDSLNFIMDKCKSGKLSDYKEAQLHLQKLMSPITELFPPSLVKFLAYGSDGSDSEIVKEV